MSPAPFPACFIRSRLHEINAAQGGGYSVGADGLPGRSSLFIVCAKTLSYIFVDHFLCGLYNESGKGRNPFVR